MKDEPRYLVARLFRSADPLVPALQVVFAASEGESFVNMVAGAMMDAMHDASGVDYSYCVRPAIDNPGPVEQLLRHARAVAMQGEHQP
jgi:hypothetical protein